MSWVRSSRLGHLSWSEEGRFLPAAGDSWTNARAADAIFPGVLGSYEVRARSGTINSSSRPASKNGVARRAESGRSARQASGRLFLSNASTTSVSVATMRVCRRLDGRGGGIGVRFSDRLTHCSWPSRSYEITRSSQKNVDGFSSVTGWAGIAPLPEDASRGCAVLAI